MELMAVTDNRQPVEQLAQHIIDIEPYVDYIQLREKGKTVRDIMKLLDILEGAHIPKPKLILNDRVDIAICRHIPTVHLPENGLAIEDVRKAFPKLRIGKSVHDVQGAIDAQQQGADYVLYGHCFMTNSKQGIAPNGLAPLHELKNILNIQVFAIGGIDVHRVPTLQQLQIDGIAVMSGIFSAPHSATAAQQYKEATQHGI